MAATIADLERWAASPDESDLWSGRPRLRCAEGRATDGSAMWIATPGLVGQHEPNFRKVARDAVDAATVRLWQTYRVIERNRLWTPMYPLWETTGQQLYQRTDGTVVTRVALAVAYCEALIRSGDVLKQGPSLLDPVVVFRRGKPVAVIMPLRTPQEN